MYDIYYFDKLKNNLSSSYLASFSKAERLDEVHGDTELYHREKVKGIEIKYIGIRLNDSGRFILAVIDGEHIKQGAHGVVIGLEITETHDYAKTLVENDARRASWNALIADFIHQLQDMPENAPTQEFKQEERKSRQIMSYRGRLLAFDTQQKIVANQPADKGIICFGGAGTGKSMLLERVLEQYVILTDGHVVHFAPNVKLCRDTLQSLKEKLSESDFSRLHSFTWEHFLDYLRSIGMDVRRTEALKQVDFDYFCAWLQTSDRYKTKQQNKEERMIRRKYSDSILWKEYLFTILQSHAPDAISPNISQETYSSLGRVQSYVEFEDRATVYQCIFKPFLEFIVADATAYEPRLMAYQLSQQLLSSPELTPHLFDALVIDEQTLFHPYQLLCMLLTHKKMSNGWFFLCGDISQSIDMLNPRFAEDLLKILQSRHVVENQLLITTLQNNHRNSEMGTRFVSLLHEIEKQIYGSFDRHTHSCVLSNGHALSGSVTTSDYSSELKHRISQDPQAVVLVPNESYKQQVLHHNQWLAGQVFTLREMQGSQVMTVVMDGFSDYHAEPLKELELYLRKGNALPTWNTSRSYAREKDYSQTLMLLEAIQAWYTVASRPIENLIITETSASIHPLWLKLINQIALKTMATSVNKTPVSKEAWLQRINVLLQENKLEQADALLLREDIWGVELLGRISACSRLQKIDLLTQSLSLGLSTKGDEQSVIYTEKPTNQASLRFFEATPKHGEGVSAKPQPSNQPSIMNNNNTTPPKAPVSKLIKAIKAILNAPTQNNFQTLYDTVIAEKYPNRGDYLRYFLKIEVPDVPLEFQSPGSEENQSCSVFKRLMTSYQAVFATKALLEFARKNHHDDPISCLKNLGIILQYKSQLISEWLWQAVNTNDINTVKDILSLGYNPNWQSTRLWNEFPIAHLATRRGFNSVLQLLIDYGANIDIFGKVEFDAGLGIDNWTPLHIAAYYDNVDAIDILMMNEAVLEKRTLHLKDTPLTLSARQQNLNAMTRLLKWGADPDSENKQGETSLHLAVLFGDVNMVKVLIEHHANVLIKPTKQSKMHFMYIAIKRDDLNMVRYFIEEQNGINCLLSVRDNDFFYNETTLIFATLKNKISIVRYLLSKGGNVDIPSHDALKRTSLMIAVINQCVDMVNLLIEFDAKVDVKCESRFTALYYAINMPPNKKSCEIVESLVKAGADYQLVVTQQDGSSTSIISLAEKKCSHCFQFMNTHLAQNLAPKTNDIPLSMQP